MDYEDDGSLQTDTGGLPAGQQSEDGEAASPQDKRLVQDIIKSIKADKAHHAKAFKRMRRDMQVAMWGAEENWTDERYRANIAGRHVKQKTAALYAKNPKATATRREQMDYAVWDENTQSLMMAMQIVQQAQVAAAAAQQQQQAMPGAAVMGGNGGPPLPPELPPGFDQAMALIADFQQGFARRQYFAKLGKTLELLFAYFMTEQQPLDFKTGMKQTVRRALTTGVGYVELGFQREMGPRPGLTEQLADVRARLDHLQRLAADLAEGEFDEDAGERAELEHSLRSLMEEPNVVMREGLIVDYPSSTKVIPDKNCKSLVGFIGARHVTLEYVYTKDEVKEIFGVDVGEGYTSYTTNAGSTRDIASSDITDDDYEWSPPGEKKNGMVCVWKRYDKPSGLVYFVADGYANFLRPPAPPDVFVETFWPVYALTFNAVESETELFPPSDVSLMIDMQREHNRSRQGLREHREAARPRWVAANGAFGSEEDPQVLRNLKPFQLAMLNMDPQTSISDILQTVPVPGVDPNLYETGPIFTDTQLVVGTQEAQFGGTSKATATESAIAANSTTSSDGSSIDDLDAFLSLIARAGGQILQGNMSEEIVREIVGPGAVWPQMTLDQISREVHLEVAAGSTGKPNQANEINNWERLLPFLLQIGSIPSEWLARETLRRLDDRLDLTEAIVSGVPSIVAQNQNAQVMPGNPANDPAAQGPEGGANAPAPPGGSGGSDAAFGSNQV
jgi:hypothetical protein